MKKIFTLLSMAFMAMSVNAQTDPVEYQACDETGKMAPEFLAVVNEQGVASNVVNGLSVVTIERGPVTCKAVGSAEAKVITLGAAIEGKENQYKIASVDTWGDVTWKGVAAGGGKTHSMNNGNKENICVVDGTGNPYTSWIGEIVQDNTTGEDKPRVLLNSKDNIYLPDGTNGLPISGLYYSIKASEKGCFKFGVWVNNGNRETFLVKVSDMKAQPLYAEGYINGQDIAVDDGNGGTVNKRKYLTVDEIKALHDASSNSDKPYIIGAGNQMFWGYLVFDVEANEEYYVFNGTTQLGFAGFKFIPGGSAEDQITPSGIKTIQSKTVFNAPIYNLAGQKVNNDYKGVVIQNGKKFVVK